MMNLIQKFASGIGICFFFVFFFFFFFFFFAWFHYMFLLNVRFYVTLLALAFLTAFIILAAWHEVQTLFGV